MSGFNKKIIEHFKSQAGKADSLVREPRSHMLCGVAKVIIIIQMATNMKRCPVSLIKKQNEIIFKKKKRQKKQLIH